MENKGKNQTFVFNALTCINPVTNLVKIIRIQNKTKQNKTSEHVAHQFKNCWLLRYPSHNRCVYDNSREFCGNEFQQILIKHKVFPAGTTVKNSQANGIFEQIHCSVADIL